MEAEKSRQCVANISTAERRKRLVFGVIMFGVSLVVMIALVVAGVNRWWRLALFPLFTGAATGYFQWRDKT